jgi:hypothetical protein
MEANCRNLSRQGWLNNDRCLVDDGASACNTPDKTCGHGSARAPEPGAITSGAPTFEAEMVGSTLRQGQQPKQGRPVDGDCLATACQRRIDASIAQLAVAELGQLAPLGCGPEGSNDHHMHETQKTPDWGRHAFPRRIAVSLKGSAHLARSGSRMLGPEALSAKAGWSWSPPLQKEGHSRIRAGLGRSTSAACGYPSAQVRRWWCAVAQRFQKKRIWLHLKSNCLERAGFLDRNGKRLSRDAREPLPSEAGFSFLGCRATGLEAMAATVPGNHHAGRHRSGTWCDPGHRL